MTPSELKYHYLQANPNGKFFSRENMKFAGDTMSNFGCRKERIDNIDYWLLYRKATTKRGFFNDFYFNAETFEREYPR